MTSTNEHILAALLDATFDLVVLVDSAGRIVEFNQACESLTGYCRDEVLGQKLLDFLVPEDSIDAVAQRFANPNSPETREPQENPWVTKSGERRLIRWRCTGLRVAENKPPYVLGIGTDVTEQRRNDDKARVQSRLLEKFFESTLTCAVLLDKEFNFIRVNEAYVNACRRSASDFIGRNHFDLYPSDAKPIFEEVVRTGQPYLAEARPFVFRDNPEWGITYWDWTLVPVLDDRGEIELLLFCLNDVTERRRAEQRLQDAMNQLRGLSQQQVDIQEQERRRIAGELHDQLGQELTALKLLLENSMAAKNAARSSRLSEALAVTNGLMESVRRISLDLRPAMLDDLGLLAALVWLLDRHRVHTGIDVSFKHNIVNQRLPPKIETAVYRIIQEALTNVARHANVWQAEVAVWITPDEVVLRIMDQGKGFDPAVATRTGSGLLGMRERAMSFGGNFTVDASVGGGATIIVGIPINLADTVRSSRQ